MIVTKNETFSGTYSVATSYRLTDDEAAEFKKLGTDAERDMFLDFVMETDSLVELDDRDPQTVGLAFTIEL